MTIQTAWIGGSYEAATASASKCRKNGAAASDICAALRNKPGMEAADIADRVSRNAQAARKMLRKLLMQGALRYETASLQRGHSVVTIKKWFLTEQEKEDERDH